MQKGQQAKPDSKYDWNTLVSLFDEVSLLPKEERNKRLIDKQLDPPTLEKLQQMLNTLDRTVSLLDTPIASRVETSENWFAENWVGQKLNGYTIDSLLHASGVTGVFKASQQSPVHRDVVIKLLRPDMPSEHVNFFRFEQLALAKLTHPNIAAIHTVEKSDAGLSFIVMEYIEGTLLSSYCDKHTLSIRERLKIFLCVCDAITYSHQHGVLHRDLKSSNILVRNLQGKHTPTVIDFGISSDLDTQTHSNQEQVVGTPEYMSPEHALNINDMDARADVYSLGMVLFNLLVGPIPFDRGKISSEDQATRISSIAEFTPPTPRSHYELLSTDEQHKIAHARGVSIKSQRGTLTKDLDLIFLKATHKERAQRYQSVLELSTDLQRYLSRRAISAHPPSTLYQIKTFIHRNSVASLAGLAVTALALLFVLKLLDQNHEIRTEFLRTQTEKQNAEQISLMVMNTLGVANPTGVKSKGKASVESMIDQTSASLRQNQKISPDFRVKLLVKLSEAYRGIGNVTKAKEIERLLNSELDSFTPVLKVNALLTLADSAELDTDHYAGLRFAKKAHDITLSNNLQGAILIQSKDALARAHILLSEFDEAEALLSSALSLINQEPTQDKTMLAKLYLSLADMAVSKGDFARAEGYYSRGKKALSAQYGENHARVVEVEIDEAQLLIQTRSPKATSDYIENLRNKIIEIWGEDSSNANLISYHLATAYKATGNLGPAISTYRKNLASLKSQNIQYAVLNIANMFGLAGSYLEANEYKKALDIAGELHDLVTEENDLGVKFTPYQVAMAQRQFGTALAANGNFEDALVYSDASIDFIKDQSASAHAISLSLRAYIYAMQNEFDSAKSDIEQSLELVLQKPDSHRDKSQTTLVTKALHLYIELLASSDKNSLAKLTELWQQYTEGLNGNTVEFPYSEIGKFIEHRSLQAAKY